MLVRPITRRLTALASPAGAGARLTVLTFHRVLPSLDPLEPDTPDVAEFERQVAWLRGQFNLLPLSEACRRLYDGSLPERAAALTIDDGYLDNHDVALPILRRHGVVATFFIATGFTDGSAMFNDRLGEAVRHARVECLDLGFLGLPPMRLVDNAEKLVALGRIVRAVKYQTLAQRRESVARIEEACGVPSPAGVMMRPQHLRAMRDAGMELGAHTRNHPILRLQTDEEAWEEIAGSRSDLQDLVGEAPLLFAFPNGRLGDDFELRHAQMARRAGFRFAFTTEGGAANAQADPMRIPRFSTWPSARWRFELRLVRNLVSGPR